MSDTIKAQSFVLARALEKLGIRLSHGNALDVMAQLQGAESWNHFLAKQSKTEPSPDCTAVDPERRALAEQAAAEVEATAGSTYAPGDRLHLLVSGGMDCARPLVRTVHRHQDRLQGSLQLLMAEEDARPRLYQEVILERTAHGFSVIKVESLTKDSLTGTAVNIELRTAHPGERMAICPLSGLMYQPRSGRFNVAMHYIGVFLPGDASPVMKSLVPSRVWDVARVTEADPTGAKTFRLSLGEMAAAYRQQ
jgi:hypothetical protein